MELTNRLYKYTDQHPEDTDLVKLVFSYLARGLYPYCPHLASEVWAACFTGDINDYENHLPAYEELRDKVKVGVTVTIQLNGKLVCTIKVPSSDAEDASKVL